MQEDSSGTQVIGLIIVILLGIWAYNAWLKPDKWQGMYELPTTNTIQAVNFDSREACEDWLYSYHPSAGYNYECGSNCTRPDRPLAVYTCEETF